MGGFLDKKSETTMDKTMVKFLRSITLSSIFEWYEYYAKTYLPKNELSRDEFDDVFSPILNDTEVFFDKLVHHEKADFYEALASMTMFSKGKWRLSLKSSKSQITFWTFLWGI